MNDLERRALLGDRQAQKECTRQGIVLPCPFCGGATIIKTQKQDYGFSGTTVKCLYCSASVYCLDERAQITESGIKNVTVGNHKYIAIQRWNTRSVPPIGRCKDCAKWRGDTGDKWSACKITDCRMGAEEYCNNFSAKE